MQLLHLSEALSFFFFYCCDILYCVDIPQSVYSFPDWWTFESFFALGTVLCCVPSHVQLFVTPWTVAHQAPLSMRILQARILERVAMPFSREPSQPRDRTQVSCIAGGFFTAWATIVIWWNIYGVCSQFLKQVKKFNLFLCAGVRNFFCVKECLCMLMRWLMLGEPKIESISVGTGHQKRLCDQLLFNHSVMSNFCVPVDCSTPGFSVLHHLPELAQIHVHWISDAIQPSHPLSSPSTPAFNVISRLGISAA